jgi:hypothetical protein
MTNAEISKLDDFHAHLRDANPRTLSKDLRRCVDEEQQRAHADGALLRAVQYGRHPIYAAESFEAAARCRKLALWCLIAAGAGCAALLIGGLSGVAYELVQAATFAAVVLAVGSGWAWRLNTHLPGMPAVLNPEKVEALGAWIRALGEGGRGFKSPTEIIATSLLISAEVFLVFSLGRDSMFPNLKLTTAVGFSLMLSLAIGYVLYELLAHMGEALRSGRMRFELGHLLDSKDAKDQARAALLMAAYPSALGAVSPMGSRVVGYALRCHRASLLWALALLLTFASTICLRLYVAGSDPAELMVLAMTAAVSLVTLLVAVVRHYQTCDISQEVAEARRVAARFPAADAFAGHVERQIGKVRIRLDFVEREIRKGGARRFRSQQSLGPLDLVSKFDAEFAARHEG